jgi:hypothetical protein
VPQKIFLCMPSFYRGGVRTKSLTGLLFRKHGVQEPLSQHLNEIGF